MFYKSWNIMATIRMFRRNCIFLKNFQYFATSPWQALDCYWLYKIWTVKRSDCSLSLLRKSRAAICRRGMGGFRKMFYLTPRIISFVMITSSPATDQKTWRYTVPCCMYERHTCDGPIE